MHSLPYHSDDAYDQPYKTAVQLHDADVKFCFSYTGFFDAWNDRNLTYLAGTSVAFGLPQAEALRALTLSTAEILGAADKLGSLEAGKSATIIVSEGDILDMRSSRVTMEFINGKPVDLDNRHERLYRKYLKRYGLEAK